MSKVLKKKAANVAISLLICALFAVGLTPSAYAAGTNAIKSSQPIFVNNRRVSMMAYSINGSNYVRLRDIGYELGLEVWYDNADGSIRINTNKPYNSLII
jgi:hypothetical protein